jgi:mono/diheme cytochrome c family protein
MAKGAIVLVMALVFAARAGAQSGPAGNADDGRKQWAVPMRCSSCHGADAEGAFGPDLAGRGLSFDQFRRAVRQPWGVMPAYSQRQLSDQALADMWTYTASLPKVAQPGRPRFATAPGAPVAQIYIVETLGCANCHGPELRFPRQVLGRDATELDFQHFAKIIYEHDALFPMGRMGSYSRRRVPESVLRDLYWFMREDLGLLVFMQAALSEGTTAGVNTTHTVTVRNTGIAGKGLTAEDLTIAFHVPDGTTVSDATGMLASAQDGTLTWKIARIAAGQDLKFTLTVPGARRPAAELVKEARIDWLKPAMRMGVPNLELTDERWNGSRNDWAPFVASQAPSAP